MLSDSYAKNIMDMLVVAESCIKDRRQIPALVLLYSLVDSMAWAASGGDSSNIRGRFEEWVSKWLIPHLPPSDPAISATDLYAARCAILHSGTGVSDLSTRKRAKRLMYAWGTGRTEALEYAIKQTGIAAEHAAIHYDDLLKSIRLAVADFCMSAETDGELAKRLEKASGVQYANIEI